MINRKDFISGNFKRGKTLSNEENNVDKFLRINKGKAYLVKEIAKATKKSKEGVRGRLRILKKNRKILHKSPYFMWK